MASLLISRQSFPARFKLLPALLFYSLKGAQLKFFALDIESVQGLCGFIRFLGGSSQQKLDSGSRFAKTSRGIDTRGQLERDVFGENLPIGNTAAFTEGMDARTLFFREHLKAGSNQNPVNADQGNNVGDRAKSHQI